MNKERIGMTLYLLAVLALIGGSNPLFAQRRLPDSITVAASERYKNHSIFKRIFLGSNYRKEWSQPVRMPVFDICDVQKGYIIRGTGGGLQTKSLQLRDNSGKEWALRTVDKNVVDEALPPGIRKGIFNRTVKKIVQDMVSAAHPYAALTIPVLSQATGVLTGSQQLFFVPDDTALGKYREDFANRVCLLEQRTLTGTNPDTEDTEQVLDSILSNNDHHIIQLAVLRARLLDMLIADWDRHPGQWKWASIKKGENTRYLAIPRDRDQAYFNSNGLLIKAVSNLTSMRHMRGFKSSSRKMKELNYKSWQFDQVFLNELERKQWEATVSKFCSDLADPIISVAVKKLPPEVYAISGAEIESKLKSRRDGLMKHVMKYYAFQAANVTIFGTGETEYFKVTAEKNLVSVAVFKNHPAEKTMLYQRTFDPKETSTIYLTGLGGKDHFEFDKGVDKIRFIINTEKNEDVFSIPADARVTVKE
jgi:hypothetical protein